VPYRRRNEASQYPSFVRGVPQQQFQASGKAINDKVRLYGRIGQALMEAKQSGTDPFAAIASARATPPCAGTRENSWRCST